MKYDSAEAEWEYDLKDFCPRASFIVLLVLSSFLLACRTSSDTLATAQQVMATASGLKAFYGALAQSVSDTTSLYEIDKMVTGLPFSAKDRQLTEETRLSLLQRESMAQAVEDFALAMNAVLDAKNTATLENAATNLGTALAQVKTIPQGSSVPTTLETVSGALSQLVRQRKLKQSAQVFDGLLATVTDVFEKERPVYDSLIRTRFRESAQVAASLIGANQVDARALLEPALKPYDLQILSLNPQLQESLHSLASTRVQEKTDDALRAELEASSAMSISLKEISSRMHMLATTQRMSLRGNPPQLKIVVLWAATLN